MTIVIKLKTVLLSAQVKCSFSPFCRFQSRRAPRKHTNKGVRQGLLIMGSLVRAQEGELTTPHFVRRFCFVLGREVYPDRSAAAYREAREGELRGCLRRSRQPLFIRIPDGDKNRLSDSQPLHLTFETTSFVLCLGEKFIPIVAQRSVGKPGRGS